MSKLVRLVLTVLLFAAGATWFIFERFDTGALYATGEAGLGRAPATRGSQVTYWYSLPASSKVPDTERLLTFEYLEGRLRWHDRTIEPGMVATHVDALLKETRKPSIYLIVSGEPKIGDITSLLDQLRRTRAEAILVSDRRDSN